MDRTAARLRVHPGMHAQLPPGVCSQVIPPPWWTHLAAWKVGLALGACATLGACAVALLPLSTSNLTSHPQPSSQYADALARFEQVRVQNGCAVNPVCHSRLLTHGKTMNHVVILLHGVTNCPQQFVALGQLLFDRGANVLIPRMPHNGLANRMTHDLQNLRASELAAFTDTLVDIAAGLGKRITIVGLSAGGILAAWAAQHRSEITRAVIVAPSFAILRMSPLPQRLVQNLFVRLPPISRVDAAKVALRKPTHTALRNNTRSTGEIMRLGLATERAARVAPPVARSVVVVTNAADVTVDNTVTAQIVEHWRARGHSGIDTYAFHRDAHLPHDLIDPDQPGGCVDCVYPVLLDLIERI